MGRKRKPGNEHLPKRVTIDRGKYYYIPKNPEEYGGKRWIKLGDNLSEVNERLKEITGLNHKKELVKDWASAAYHRAKTNAKERGIPFLITLEDFKNIIERAGGKCEVSGIAFCFKTGRGEFRRRPFIPSLDRIDSSKPYEYDNLRLVCAMVNSAMSDYPDSLFFKMCKRVTENARSGIKGENIR